MICYLLCITDTWKTSTVNSLSDFRKASIFDLFFLLLPWQVTITLNKQRPTFSCNSKIWTSGKTQRKSTRISRARQIPTTYSSCLMPSQMSLSRTISRTVVCFNQVKTKVVSLSKRNMWCTCNMFLPNAGSVSIVISLCSLSS